MKFGEEYPHDILAKDHKICVMSLKEHIVTFFNQRER